MSLFKNDDNNKTNELPFDLGRVAKPGRWERRKTAFQAKKQNPALQAMRGRSRMTRQLRQGQDNQIDTLVDCAGVTCPSLASCFKKIYTPGACCPSCKHEGCKCAEGAELAACTQNGFKRGILPVGQGFKAHEGTTCTCYSAGDPILCVMTPDESDYGVMTERTPTYRANNRRNPQFPQRRDAVNNGGQSQDLYNNYGDYSAYSSQQQYSDDSAGQVATNQTQSRYNENYYGDYYAGYYGGYGPSLTQYNAYEGKVCISATHHITINVENLFRLISINPLLMVKTARTAIAVMIRNMRCRYKTKNKKVHIEFNRLTVTSY